MADKYNAEGYFSPTEHEAFTRLEKEEKGSPQGCRLPTHCVYMLSLLRRYGEKYQERQEIQPLCRRQALSADCTSTSILRSSWTTIFQRNGIQPFL